MLICSSCNSLYLSGFDLEVCWTLQPNKPPLTLAISLQSQGMKHVPKVILWWPQPQQRAETVLRRDGIPLGQLWLWRNSEQARCCSDPWENMALPAAATHLPLSAASLLWQRLHSKSLWHAMTFLKFLGEGLRCFWRVQAVAGWKAMQGRLKASCPGRVGSVASGVQELVLILWGAWVDSHSCSAFVFLQCLCYYCALTLLHWKVLQYFYLRLTPSTLPEA